MPTSGKSFNLRALVSSSVKGDCNTYMGVLKINGLEYIRAEH